MNKKKLKRLEGFKTTDKSTVNEFLNKLFRDDCKGILISFFVILLFIFLITWLHK